MLLSVWMLREGVARNLVQKYRESPVFGAILNKNADTLLVIVGGLS
jgi:hypothetical protein